MTGKKTARKSRHPFQRMRAKRKEPKMDTTPLALPVGMRQPPTLAEEVRRFVRQELSESASQAGSETFEEADDFTEEDPDRLPLTPYELTAMQAEEPAGGYDPDSEPADPPLEPPPEGAEKEAQPTEGADPEVPSEAPQE